MEITLHLTDDVANALLAEARARHISVEQVATEKLKLPSPKGKLAKVSYASFFGAAKGQLGSFGSVEAVDKYLSDLRDEW